MRRADGARSEPIITRLRIKIIAMTMGILLIVVFLLIATINLFMHETSRMQASRSLDYLTMQGVAAQSGASSDSPPQMPRGNGYFVVAINGDGTVRSVQAHNLQGLADEDARAMAIRVFREGSPEGTLNNMQYKMIGREGGSFIAFVELSIQNLLLSTLLRVSIYVACVSGIILFFAAILLSKWVTEPIRQSLLRQKQFISDASHEMKTPLTIIAANADVLTKRGGENKWLLTIQAQTRKMSELVQNLLLLARSSEMRAALGFERFDASQVVLTTALAFESRMFEEGKRFDIDVQEGICILGSEHGVEQLVSILLDNAIKYSDDHGAIALSFAGQGNRAFLSVHNTGIGLHRREVASVFQRFYRGDASRNTGGYGLGLAIAWEIVHQHGGKIAVTGEEGKDITFTVQLRIKEGA